MVPGSNISSISKFMERNPSFKRVFVFLLLDINWKFVPEPCPSVERTVKDLSLTRESVFQIYFFRTSEIPVI